MRLLLKLFAILTLSLPAWSQFTSVTASPVQDANGAAYQNGSYSIDLVPSPSGTTTLKLGASALFPQHQVGSLDGSGNLSVTLVDNTQITPAGSQWRFSICDGTGKFCGQVLITISGGSQNVQAALAAGLPLLNQVGLAQTINTLRVNGSLSAKFIDNVFYFEELYPGADAGTRANAACADATAKGGGHVMFPDGNVSINATVNGCNDVIFEGAGKDATVLVPGLSLGANRIFWSNGSAGSHVVNTGLANMTVQNGTPSTGSYTVGMDGARFDYTDGAILDNVRFTSIQGPYGATVKNSTKVRWSKVQADNFTYCGFCVQTDNVDVWLTDVLVDTATTTLTPAYGISASGAEDALGTNYSSDIHVVNATVKNILSWQCFDDHGGTDHYFENITCINSHSGMGVQVAQSTVANPIGTRIHVDHASFTQGSGTADGTGLFVLGNSGATPITDSTFTDLTFSGYGPSATGSDISAVVKLDWTRNLQFNKITCNNGLQDCFNANSWNQDIAINNLTSVDTAGGKNSGLSAAFIMRSLGNYGITLHGLTVGATSAAGVPAAYVRCGGVIDGGLVIDGISGVPPSSALFSNCARTLLNLSTIPTTGSILAELFDPFYLTTGQIGATVSGPATGGFASFDSTTAVVLVNMTSGSNIFTLNANGSFGGNSSDLRWLPLRANINIAGAGVAAANLGPCVVAKNDLTTVTLVTTAGAACNASTTVTGGAGGTLTYAALTTSPFQFNAAGNVTGRTFTSNVATGTAPFTVASTTNVPNLNASSLSGATFAAPGAIGSTTPATGFTLGTGGSALALIKKLIDTPGAITVNANTCTDRTVADAGILATAVIGLSASYALDAGIVIGPGFADNGGGNAHYRICNVTGVNITLNAAAAFNLTVTQ